MPTDWIFLKWKPVDCLIRVWMQILAEQVPDSTRVIGNLFCMRSCQGDLIVSYHMLSLLSRVLSRYIRVLCYSLSVCCILLRFAVFFCFHRLKSYTQTERQIEHRRIIRMGPNMSKLFWPEVLLFRLRLRSFASIKGARRGWIRSLAQEGEWRWKVENGQNTDIKGYHVISTQLRTKLLMCCNWVEIYFQMPYMWSCSALELWAVQKRTFQVMGCHVPKKPGPKHSKIISCGEYMSILNGYQPLNYFHNHLEMLDNVY